MLQAPLVGRHSFRWRLWPADREPSRDICPLTTFTHSVQWSVPYNNLRHRHQKKVGEGRLLRLFKVHAPFRSRLCFVPRSALSLAGIAHALHQRWVDAFASLFLGYFGPRQEGLMRSRFGFRRDGRGWWRKIAYPFPTKISVIRARRKTKSKQRCQ